MGQRSGQFLWILCPGSHQAAIRMSARLSSYLETHLGKKPSSFGSLTKLISLLLDVCLRDLDSSWLVSGGCPQVLEVTHNSLSWILSVGSLQHGSLLLQDQPLTLSLQFAEAESSYRLAGSSPFRSYLKRLFLNIADREILLF